ncbi:hypothetical protein CSUI_005640 [Cystoisospora suis]|uniref:Uncharacterized protein n=1 Tax=Cystoisospora suis TaxID=483139 RepID=A0A2C6KWD7_9APIC|nr:hypothetical protein CSUI_005640 [Cystoisospora suis]
MCMRQLSTPHPPCEVKNRGSVIGRIISIEPSVI